MQMNMPQNSMSDEMVQPDTESPQEDQGEPGETNPNAITKLLQSKNIAEGMDEMKLTEIGAKCRSGFENDLMSREDWARDLKDWTELTVQIRKEKTFPWVDCSNVQYPILSTASMQFAARAYPSLVPSDGKIVKGVVIGKDPDGKKTSLADRVSTYMSWQIMHDMDDWEEDMDKLLLMLPIAGTVFKKTYWDTNKEKVCSRLVLPMNLVVDNWTRSLEEAERISEIIPMTGRILKERMNKGTFLDIDLGQPTTPQLLSPQNENSTGKVDESTPYTLIQQHCFLDLDEDEYSEPYTVTFQRESGKVLSIVPRFRVQDVQADKGKVVSITPTHYYTKFSFVPNPDGSFYSIGFGRLLGPLNEAINTLINQLIDGGTMSTLQSGFIGKGLRLKAGTQAFSPGEWKPVNATGDDLRKQIVPLPAKEPSKVLLELMANLVTASKELASVAEIFVGKMPGQNTPATTTMATIDQGMKVFTAVYKRIYRSLQSEFYKIFELNAIFTNPETEAAVLDMPIGPNDFDDKQYDICPAADPNAMSQSEKLQKAQGLLEMLTLGTLDVVEVTKRNLQAQEQPNWETLLNKSIQQTGEMPPAPPDPKAQEIQMKQQAEQQKIGLQAQAQQGKMQLEAAGKQQEMAQSQQQHQLEMQQAAQKAQLDNAVTVHGEHAKIIAARATAQQDMHNKQQMHTQDLHNSKELNKSKQQAMMVKARQKPSTAGKGKK